MEVQPDHIFKHCVIQFVQEVRSNQVVMEKLRFMCRPETTVDQCEIIGREIGELYANTISVMLIAMLVGTENAFEVIAQAVDIVWKEVTLEIESDLVCSLISRNSDLKYRFLAETKWNHRVSETLLYQLSNLPGFREFRNRVDQEQFVQIMNLVTHKLEIKQ